MLKLPSKFFDHSKSCYYREWNEELVKSLNGYLPSWNGNRISIGFHIERCRFSFCFSVETGEFVEVREYFKTTKTPLSLLCVPILELFIRLERDGYLDYESEDTECQE